MQIELFKQQPSRIQNKIGDGTNVLTWIKQFREELGYLKPVFNIIGEDYDAMNVALIGANDKGLLTYVNLNEEPGKRTMKHIFADFVLELQIIEYESEYSKGKSSIEHTP